MNFPNFLCSAGLTQVDYWGQGWGRAHTSSGEAGEGRLLPWVGIPASTSPEPVPGCKQNPWPGKKS